MDRRQLRELTNNFLNRHVFQGLHPYIVEPFFPNIPYFDEEDFQIVLQRVQILGLSIYGIEPWLNGEFFDVETYYFDPDNPNWYFSAFEKFKKLRLPLRYSASYHVPEIRLIVI